MVRKSQDLSGEGMQSGSLQALVACTKGAGEARAGRCTGALLCSPLLYKLQWLFFQIPPYKTDLTQRPVSKSLGRLLMTCLGSRACSAQYCFNLAPALDCVSRHTDWIRRLFLPWMHATPASCVPWFLLELFPIKGEFQLKQTNT